MRLNCNPEDLVLHAPVDFSPRGLPGVKVGKEWVSIDYTCQLPGRFHWYLDFEHGESYRQMTPPVPNRASISLQAGLASLLFCLARANDDRPPIHDLLKFPYGVVRWAREHHPELMRVVNEINNLLHAGESIIREPGPVPRATGGERDEEEPQTVCNRDCE